MLPVVASERADADLLEILNYLDEHSPVAAERFATALTERCLQLGRLPGMGRSREELRPGIRSIVVEKYVVFFRVTESSVRILRILHGARDMGSAVTED
jgi:toxin ParE1/3/4